MLFDAPTPPAASRTHAPLTQFGFQHAFLGETLTAWRAAAGPGVRCQTASAPLSNVTCSTPPVALGRRQIAHDISYQFIGGRLTRIRFITSIDAYNLIRAGLDVRFGSPDLIIRDSIKIDQSLITPHLKARWRNQRSIILLDDPEQDGRSLSVTYTLVDGAGDLRPPAT